MSAPSGWLVFISGQSDDANRSIIHQCRIKGTHLVWGCILQSAANRPVSDSGAVAAGPSRDELSWYGDSFREWSLLINFPVRYEKRFDFYCCFFFGGSVISCLYCAALPEFDAFWCRTGNRGCSNNFIHSIPIDVPMDRVDVCFTFFLCLTVCFFMNRVFFNELCILFRTDSIELLNRWNCSVDLAIYLIWTGHYDEDPFSSWAER